MVKNGRLGSICGRSWLRDDVRCREIGFAFLGQEGSMAEGPEALAVEPVARPMDFQ
jgi:hypothetical protein